MLTSFDFVDFDGLCRSCIRSSDPDLRTGPHVHEHLNDDEMKPYAHLIPTILDRGLQVLLYQGHMDLRDGVAATEVRADGLM